MEQNEESVASEDEESVKELDEDSRQDYEKFCKEGMKLYHFIKNRKQSNAPDCGSDELNGMGGIPTFAGMKKLLMHVKKKIEKLPEDQRIVLELGSSTGFASVIYFAILLDCKVWGCEVNRSSFINSLVLHKYLLGDTYKTEDVTNFVDQFQGENQVELTDSKLINVDYLSKIGSKLKFNYTKNNPETLEMLDECDRWRSSISIVYAFCDGISEEDLKWHIEEIWNKIASLKFIITSEPLSSDMKLYNHGFDRKNYILLVIFCMTLIINLGKVNKIMQSNANMQNSKGTKVTFLFEIVCEKPMERY